MHRLIGHAIVSADDRIADAAGQMPAALHNEHDWALFQAALDSSALILIGRASHAATPNRRGRLRLILSRSVSGLERRSDGFWLNSTATPLAKALDAILPKGGDVAVVGGQGAFELVSPAGFAAFHLARAERLRLPGGRGLFRACEAGVPATTVLAGGGLVIGSETAIDPDAGVTLAIWRRPDDL